MTDEGWLVNMELLLPIVFVFRLFELFTDAKDEELTLELDEDGLEEDDVE